MSNLDELQIKKAKELVPVFKTVGTMYEFDEEVDNLMSPNFTKHWFTYLLMGIASRESHFGLLLDKNGKGDSGHGHGIMQIDDRSHKAYIAKGTWKDPENNIEYGADVWMWNFNYFVDRSDVFDDYIQMVWASTAAYNCGAGNVMKAIRAGQNIDSRTTGKDYSADVRVRMKFLASLGIL